MEFGGRKSAAKSGYATGVLRCTENCRGMMGPFARVIWIVLDSVGIGGLPDAADYGDVGRSTLGHIAESRALQIPTLVQLGLANIEPLAHLPPDPAPIGAY